VAHKLAVLARHCERAGRDPAEITRTVFATAIPPGPAEFARQLGAYAAAGADGVVILGGPDDAARITELGQVVMAAFPP
jgi:hypothetical protein